ncbi:alkyl hydroperoxide reductase/ Thiol specific antioxidant/ Mal allergen [Paenibacillus curdlanolyticus YK9]|uniref:thioredoxin-dependent peroxiredoxin n=1 Tax=Paenibacillus curdlanolyticus YK9 TaxID=717606 RepID=E0IAW4_9BACL|nr:thioredoxin-dependent thiol peroxidase [Paenibacillus curdlanolyticus]EFM10255.1 alkyl hydroperoxide reductase/ Thiol specific antioxidant/ Mal allergen [Paenibacillus curdlanolyticus YK9]
MATKKQSTAEVGKPAPAFTLEGSGGKPVSLGDYIGKKVILFFYPKDMTTACTQEACDFRDAHVALKGRNTVILGISMDDTARHGKFIAKYDLPYELLTDAEHAVCELYGVWQLKKLYGREYMGIVRSTFLIDEQGVLVQEWRNLKVKGHVDNVVAAIAAAESAKV